LRGRGHFDSLSAIALVGCEVLEDVSNGNGERVRPRIVEDFQPRFKGQSGTQLVFDVRGTPPDTFRTRLRRRIILIVKSSRKES
jgi:hypothetical protein